MSAQDVNVNPQAPVSEATPFESTTPISTVDRLLKEDFLMPKRLFTLAGPREADWLAVIEMHAAQFRSQEYRVSKTSFVHQIKEHTIADLYIICLLIWKKELYNTEPHIFNLTSEWIKGLKEKTKKAHPNKVERDGYCIDKYLSPLWVVIGWVCGLGKQFEASSLAFFGHNKFTFNEEPHLPFPLVTYEPVYKSEAYYRYLGEPHPIDSRFFVFPGHLWNFLVRRGRDSEKERAERIARILPGDPAAQLRSPVEKPPTLSQFTAMVDYPYDLDESESKKLPEVSTDAITKEWLASICDRASPEAPSSLPSSYGAAGAPDDDLEDGIFPFDAGY
ncbi:hypothetical protein BJ508DRAFT_22590 [Ascobolus immersus RN42]|uniref:Uncharacterized protein n=1 Tax=Ascobolus immersus RN42 TaxID=1160509 RepID=A0A3N4HTG1_ASCIM|nr:hypothetical protein BJ508DRAFT_22590 [Ascobolus immersus RN42]